MEAVFTTTLSIHSKRAGYIAGFTFIAALIFGIALPFPCWWLADGLHHPVAASL